MDYLIETFGLSAGLLCSAVTFTALVLDGIYCLHRVFG